MPGRLPNVNPIYETTIRFKLLGFFFLFVCIILLMVLYFVYDINDSSLVISKKPDNCTTTDCKSSTNKDSSVKLRDLIILFPVYSALTYLYGMEASGYMWRDPINKRAVAVINISNLILAALAVGISCWSSVVTVNPLMITVCALTALLLLILATDITLIVFQQ